MRLGFTGTRHGTTPAQRELVWAFLRTNKVLEFHHGDCVGADEEAHTLSLMEDIPVVIHPPKAASQRAFCGTATILPAKPYLTRNRDIVDATDLLLATPGEMTERLSQSGTWATVRYARKLGRPICILLPDGSADWEGEWPT